MINTNKTRKHVGYVTPAAALKQFDGRFHVTLVTVGAAAPSFYIYFMYFSGSCRSTCRFRPSWEVLA